MLVVAKDWGMSESLLVGIVLELPADEPSGSAGVREAERSLTSFGMTRWEGGGERRAAW